MRRKLISTLTVILFNNSDNICVYAIHSLRDIVFDFNLLALATLFERVQWGSLSTSSYYRFFELMP